MTNVYRQRQNIILSHSMSQDKEHTTGGGKKNRKNARFQPKIIKTRIKIKQNSCSTSKQMTFIRASRQFNPIRIPMTVPHTGTLKSKSRETPHDGAHPHHVPRSPKAFIHSAHVGDGARRKKRNSAGSFLRLNSTCYLHGGGFACWARHRHSPAPLSQTKTCPARATNNKIPPFFAQRAKINLQCLRPPPLMRLKKTSRHIGVTFHDPYLLCNPSSSITGLCTQIYGH
jgi:hypothetical protein